MNLLLKILAGMLIAGLTALISYTAVAADAATAPSAAATPNAKGDAMKKEEAKPAKQEDVKKIVSPASAVAAPTAK